VSLVFFLQNLDVNQAVNNLLSREDEDDDGQECGTNTGYVHMLSQYAACGL